MAGFAADNIVSVQVGAPAVFKITSYSHSAAAVWSRCAYISREGELEAEGPAGERYALAELEQVLAEGEGKRRLAMSAFVTFPRGTDAARAFFAEAFAANHDSVLAGPRATANFHVHIVIQARGHDGKQIRIGRDDLQDLRLLFAEKAAEQGIALDAAPRWARGEDKARTAGAERRAEEWGAIGAEGRGGQRSIEDQRGRQPRHPQRPDKRGRLPRPPQRWPRGARPPLPGQLGGQPTRIQKHQAGDRPGRLAPPPVLPGGDDIRPGLFLRGQDFFFSSGAIGATPATPP